jgi:hypothetical protein
MGLMVGVVLAGNLHAQDKSASSKQTFLTNGIVAFNFEARSEPTIQLGSSTLLTGLFVDFSQPSQTWAMLNPPGPVQEPPPALAPSLPPIEVPPSLDDPANVRGANFVLLRLSFP